MSSRNTALFQGNTAFRDKNYPEAIRCYIEALVSRHALSKTVAGNIALARNRYRAARTSLDRPRVAVCCWDLAHNAAGRAHTLAQMYESFADVEIIGSIFSARDHRIWFPIQDTHIPVHGFLVENEEDFLVQATTLVAEHPCDVLHLSKPRLPNILIGMLYKRIWGTKVLVDVDDDELDFVNATTAVSLDRYLLQHTHLPPLRDLAGHDWTRLAVALAQGFDGITVVNHALQHQYGGQLLRHARNEAIFQPPSKKRQQESRKKFDLPPDGKVVLFLGTPREFKGLLETAQAIAQLKRQDIVFAIVGDFPDPDLKARLLAIADVNYAFIANQPISALPEIAGIGNVCVLMQDVHSAAARHQTPAKLTDALALGLPVLATETPALSDAFVEGAVLPVSMDTLATQLTRILDDEGAADRLRQAGLRYFQRELSFSANIPRLRQVLLETDNRPLSKGVEDLGSHIGGELLNGLSQIPKARTTTATGQDTRQSATPAHKVAVVAHVYYDELWPELASRLKGISSPFDLFVTTPPELADAVGMAVQRDFPTANIRVFPNHGMDIVPFLSLVPDLVRDNYLVVCKIHTKRGQNPSEGSLWRNVLLDALVGDQTTFADVIDTFARDPALHSAGLASMYLSARKLMLDNEPALAGLFEQLEGRPLPSVDWGFFVGTMFWVRPASMEAVARHILQHIGQLESSYDKDGQVVHAIERYFGLLPVLQHGRVGLLYPANGEQYPPRTVAARRYVVGCYPAAAAQPGQAWISDITRQYAHLEEDLGTLAESGLFDVDYYATQCPDLPHQVIDLPTHYLLVGRFLGKTPHPEFDPSFYTASYSGKLRNGEDPFLHYLRIGARDAALPHAKTEQTSEDIPNFRFRALNTLLIDWHSLRQQARDPDLVSIVIPVYGQKKLTEDCIRSVIEHTPAGMYELVLVDNGSDQRTRQALKYLAAINANLSLVENDENLCFSLGSNLGFAASKGGIVVFLNNDTQVTSGWLEPIVAALSSGGAVAVQPRLYFPDGRVQCLGVVFSDKSPIGIPLYSGLQPNDSWAMHPRELQAVTGACLAVRAPDFIDAKGFDPIYVNGQEDLDLCLRMGINTGKPCALVPESLVIHCEGQSEDRYKFSMANRANFVARWRGKIRADAESHFRQDRFVAIKWESEGVGNPELLVYRPKLIDAAELATSAAAPQPGNAVLPSSVNTVGGPEPGPTLDRSRFRVLLVSYYCPTRAHAGGLRILDMYKLMRQMVPGIQIDLLTHFRPAIDWTLDDVNSLFHNVFLSEHERLTPEVLFELAGGPVGYDVVDLQFHQAAYEIDSFRRVGAKIIYTPMESLLKVAYLQTRALRDQPRDTWAGKLFDSSKHALEEVGFCDKVDQVVCVSRADAALLRAVTSLRSVTWIETGVSLYEFSDALEPHFSPPAAVSRAPVLLYVAYFGSETNVKALQWYLDFVHPLVLARVPDYEFVVVGRGDLSSFAGYKHSSINFVGEVDSIAPWIAKARVGIAPALSGAGFRGKVNQYAVLGVPTVASTIAHKGLDYQHGDNIFVADAPEDFAKHCVQLLTDLALNDAMGRSARRLCLDRYSWQSKWRKIRDVYGIPKYNRTDGRPLVTALVPSYNHGRYIKERIESILNQTYDKIELIVIDDRSSDNSHEVISQLQRKHGFTYIRNRENSGTPFSAWEKICDLATGDFIWVCESDDVAEPTLVEKAINALTANPNATLFYSSSHIIDESSQVIGHTDSYFHEVWRESRWDHDFTASGFAELVQYQIKGQTVPNMSSAIISASAFRASFTPFLKRLRLTGDWLFIGDVMRFGDVIYTHETLSRFRKHQVTSRVRVKSARSQAEFMLTKFKLFCTSGLPTSELAQVVRTDGHRFLYEPESWLMVSKAMAQISISDSVLFLDMLVSSLKENGDVLADMIGRYQLPSS